MIYQSPRLYPANECKEKFFMNGLSAKEKLDVTSASLLTALCMVWGLNAVAIKIANVGIDPIFGAGLRSVIATACLIVWMRFKRIPLFAGNLCDGIVVGFLFGTEFSILYPSLVYTTAASAWILLYTTPFFHAIGAHFFLKGDLLNWHKGVGMLLAFAGMIVLLSKDIALPSNENLFGDFLAISAAVFWAATTIYIKRRLVGRVSHYHTLFYQTIFSIPVFFITSTLFRETPVHHVNAQILFSLAFQGIIIAFISYLLWFFLVHAYPASLLSSFTFLTPLFATLAGIVFLNEPITLKLVVALILVSLGIYIVNRQ
jgi:drug/metabolite transporter (DMT)-like permease